MTERVRSGGAVTAVAADSAHRFSKSVRDEIELVAGLGVRGDAHFGAAVQHRSRVAANPSQPNLRQVHLIHEELLDELRGKGFDVAPGTMGENITTRGVDLLELPAGSMLRIGRDALLALPGLRNPCHQLDDHQPGLMRAVLDRGHDGRLIRKAGVMAIVISSGMVRAGDAIDLTVPPEPLRPLERLRRRASLSA